MSEGQGTSTGEYSFKAFASHDYYSAVTESLIEASEIAPGQKVIELACGTGMASRMILERLRGARESMLIGIDVSSQALREAMGQLASFRDVAVQLVQNRAEQLSVVVKGHVDRVLFTNGIHYVADKDTLLDEVNTKLTKGGLFAFNTAFFHGSNPPETEQFYRRWMMRAIRTLKNKYNLTPKSEKVESRRQLTAEEYTALLQAHGFTIVRKEITPVPINLQGWLDISGYEDFIQGTLPGVPLEPACKSLQESVRQVMAELHLQAVPRNWLSVVAAKA